MSYEVHINVGEFTIRELLETMASSVDERYYFLPFWFEKQRGDHFVMHHLENLPEHIQERIKDLRHGE